MSAASKPPSLGNRIAPPRFIAFALLAAAGIPVAASLLDWQRGVMLGFDIAAAIFLLSCLPLLMRGSPASMRQSALHNDANRAVLLAITVGVTIVVLVAVAAELSQAQRSDMATTGLIVGSLAIAWTFSNSVYALHYAHLFYTRGKGGTDSRGLDFPGADEPDYWDFLYFAFTLGMTFQTSDVEIGDPRFRRVATFHCLAAFIFNIGVLAFTINVLGS
jgi:uncharacterized membrane protein